jgi:uncharacterized membrane protein
MKDRLLNVWNQVHTSFWFVPTVMAVAAALLSFLALDLDRLVGEKFAQSMGFIWSGGAQGARSLLSTIAGSMITVAGTVFSITIVALTLASSQFGPRLLRNFVRDTGNQITLGTFTATFLYCILILRTIRAQDEGAFVPYISVTIGVGLAVASLGVLIYFVHHVSITIQAENLIARVGRELRDSVDAHFPEIGQKEPDASIMQVEFQQSLDSMRCAMSPVSEADISAPSTVTPSSTRAARRICASFCAARRETSCSAATRCARSGTPRIGRSRRSRSTTCAMSSR